jgi:hypothetical protein
MQQFTVPQFIDVEDKIIGPVTTRQFFISLAGLLLIFVVYRIADFSLFVVLGVFLAIFTGIIAFLRVNGRPFHEFLIDLLQVMKRPRMRIWQKISEAGGSLFEQLPQTTPLSLVARPRAQTARTISELALLVDTGGLIHQREQGE